MRSWRRVPPQRRRSVPHSRRQPPTSPAEEKGCESDHKASGPLCRICSIAALAVAETESAAVAPTCFGHRERRSSAPDGGDQLVGTAARDVIVAGRGHDRVTPAKATTWCVAVRGLMGSPRARSGQGDLWSRERPHRRRGRPGPPQWRKRDRRPRWRRRPGHMQTGGKRSQLRADCLRLGQRRMGRLTQGPTTRPHGLHQDIRRQLQLALHHHGRRRPARAVVRAGATGYVPSALPQPLAELR